MTLLESNTHAIKVNGIEEVVSTFGLTSTLAVESVFIYNIDITKK